LSSYSSLKPGAVEHLNAFEVADARQALKLLGAQFISRYPKSAHVLEVKFNIARSYYEDGEYPKAAELFRDFALKHPEHADAAVAGNLALDALRQLNDFKGLEATGRAFLAAKLPPAFLADAQKILTESKGEALGELALKSAEETGDVVQGLIKVADENKGGDIGEKALYGAFVAAREKRDLRSQREVGARLVNEYPRSSYQADVISTLGRTAAERARVAEAAGWYEQLGQRMKTEATGLDGWISGAKLRLAMGELSAAAKDFELAAETAGPRKAEVLVQLAEIRLKQKESAKARALAEQVLKLDRQNAEAAAIIAEVQATTSPNEKTEGLVSMLTAISNGPNGQSEATAKGLWFLGEILYREYRAIPSAQIEEKVAALQQLEGIFGQAAQMGSAEWTVASLWKIALAYAHLADLVEATPMPSGLKPAELDQFKAAVKEQVVPLKERSESAFKACVSRAEQLEVFSPALMGCRTRTETAQSPIPPAPEGRPAHTEEQQKKVEAVMDAASLEALGLAYLQAMQLSLAQLTLSRAVELEDARASAHSALGYAMLLQGDPMGARAEYGKALEADPTYPKARANLAALHCRFRDPAGAKQVLAVIKEAASLSGPDLDPEWKACR
jgi:Flp pilus assembly protein TadD